MNDFDKIVNEVMKKLIKSRFSLKDIKTAILDAALKGYILKESESNTKSNDDFKVDIPNATADLHNVVNKPKYKREDDYY